MSPVHLTVCRHYALEVGRVLREPAFDGVTYSFYDGLCERIPISWEELQRAADQAPPGAVVRVVGGPCLSRVDAGHPPMDGVEVHRFDPCFHLVAPRELVNHLLSRRCFVTSPGWLVDWRRVLETWGLDRDTARALFRESSACIHLLDTGVLEDAEARLGGMASYLDLPWEITSVGVEHFRLHLERVVTRARLEKAREEGAVAARRVADLEAIVDTLGMIGGAVREAEAVDRLRQLAAALFGSGTVSYLPVIRGEPGPCHPAERSCGKLREDVVRFLESDELASEIDGGFLLRLRHQAELVGALVVRDLMVAEYRDRYMLLARSMADAFALAIAHARVVEFLERERKEIEQHLQAPSTGGELPTICAGCKKVREGEAWMPVDGWLLRHTGLIFSHGLCPDCRAKYFG